MLLAHLFSTFHCSPLSPLQVLPKMGVTVSVIDPADINSLAAALEQHSVRWLRRQGLEGRSGICSSSQRPITTP